jgi:hypothetical protein
MATPVATLDVLTDEHLRAKWQTTRDGQPVDVTAWPVFMALVTPGAKPSGGDWHTGSWETASGVYYALCEVGGDGISLSAGTFDWYVRADGDFEKPVRNLGRVRVT